jgi:hypothetical protein
MNNDLDILAIGLAILLAFVTLASEAAELSLLEVEFKHAVGTNRSWNIPENEEKGGEVNINMRVDGKKFYKFTRIKTMYTRQFRYGAYVGELGYKVNKDVEIFLHHESQHAMDYNLGFKYPNENSIGLRVKLK